MPIVTEWCVGLDGSVNHCGERDLIIDHTGRTWSKFKNRAGYIEWWERVNIQGKMGWKLYVKTVVGTE